MQNQSETETKNRRTEHRPTENPAKNISAGLCLAMRRYRKANGLTLEELGQRINKSKSTMWKYENGEVDMNIHTMGEIARVLNISLMHFIATAISETGMSDNGATERIFDEQTAVATGRYYMYFYNGKTRKLVRSLLTITKTAIEEQRFQTALFYAVEQFETPEQCHDFYTGTAYVTSPYMNFSFRNVNNPVENVFIVAKESFKKNGTLNGIGIGISYKDFQPGSFKIILSDCRLKEDEALVDWLKINLGPIRKTNTFTLEEDYDNLKRI